MDNLERLYKLYWLWVDVRHTTSPDKVKLLQDMGSELYEKLTEDEKNELHSVDPEVPGFFPGFDNE